MNPNSTAASPATAYDTSIIVAQQHAGIQSSAATTSPSNLVVVAEEVVENKASYFPIQGFSGQLAKGLNNCKPDITAAIVHCVIMKWQRAYMRYRRWGVDDDKRRCFRSRSQLASDMPYLGESTIADAVGRLIEKKLLTITGTRNGVTEYHVPPKVARRIYTKAKIIRFLAKDAVGHGVLAAILMNNLRFAENFNLNKLGKKISRRRFLEKDGVRYYNMNPDILVRNLPYHKRTIASRLRELTKANVLDRYDNNEWFFASYGRKTRDIKPSTSDIKPSTLDIKPSSNDAIIEHNSFIDNVLNTSTVPLSIKAVSINATASTKASTTLSGQERAAARLLPEREPSFIYNDINSTNSVQCESLRETLDGKMHEQKLASLADGENEDDDPDLMETLRVLLGQNVDSEYLQDLDRMTEKHRLKLSASRLTTKQKIDRLEYEEISCLYDWLYPLSFNEESLAYREPETSKITFGSRLSALPFDPLSMEQLINIILETGISMEALDALLDASWESSTKHWNYDYFSDRIRNGRQFIKYLPKLIQPPIKDSEGNIEYDKVAFLECQYQSALKYVLSDDFREIAKYHDPQFNFIEYLAEGIETSFDPDAVYDPSED